MDSSTGSIKSSFSPVPYFTCLICLLFVVLLSFELSPSAEGHGTHRQLGLPPCGFLTVTGYPCPSCGLTTSFAYFVRGNVLDSLRAQPFGTVLFLVFIFIGMISVVGMVKRIPLSYFLDSSFFEKTQVMLLVMCLVSWVYKIYVMHG